MKTTDNVSPELRKIEKEIDSCYKSNPLLKLPFAAAAWSLLAFGEEVMLRDTRGKETGIQHSASITDNLVNDLKAPMSWLYSTCVRGGQVPHVYDNNIYRLSWNLFELGHKYRWFALAYTLASYGWMGLELHGVTIQSTEDPLIGIEYEAYNHLIKSHTSQEVLSSVNPDDFPIDAIAHSVKIKDGRFRYKLNPKMVSDTITALISPTLDASFSLPSEWQFSRYTLAEFRKVFEAISAIASIHATARRIAADMGCTNLGYTDSIYIPTCSELRTRVARYSGLPDVKVGSIFDDLTYGNRDIKHPDPALQPLIELNSAVYAIMPFLWLSISPERNLTVLLNKLPSEKKIYAKLVKEKEILMRQLFNTHLSDKNFRLVWGNVPGLPDVDLAIIKDSEKTCLLLELKWFIYPGEAREIIEKSKEIEKGISQVLKLKQAFADNHEPLLKKLGIAPSYRFEGIVASENWIGSANVQSPEVPVIQVNHLVARLKVAESLQSVMEWLQERKYLPKEGKHFSASRSTLAIGKWYLRWYEIKPLIKDAFFPL